MVEKLVGYGLQYSCYLLEIGLLVLLIRHRYQKRLACVGAYLVSLLSVGFARSYALYTYGLASRQYAYSFYLTDFFLELAAFLVVCAFFNRACLRETKMWRFVRLLMVSVFILVLGISWHSLSRSYSQIVTRFIVEFEQNLYFTCLVLNTMLYLLMQQIRSADDELELLVCGMGIQFAGPAAGWALVTLTPGQQYSASLVRFIMPLCTLGMLLTWSYAVARMPKVSAAPAGEPGGHKRAAEEFAVPTA